MDQLPVASALPELRSILAAGRNAVLIAPPGAGKSTRVPLALLEEAWVSGRVLMLEPRRIAARAAARYMARLRHQAVGGTVGYRVRLDAQVSAATRIEVITEGVLTRMLQDDPALEGVSLLIFDEFHERSLHADLGLTLALQSQQVLRPDLRILVMSATLEGSAVAALIGGSVVESTGRSHPVETVYRQGRSEGRIEPVVAAAVLHALEHEPGDVLVFLPGTAEIRRTQQDLLERGLPAQVQLHTLHGSLSGAEQDRAIAPAPAGMRKVVLATAVAETSLTIEGVRTVIDSGLMRVPRFSPRTGMTGLETVRVTRAAAEQRRGRAGRVAPGVCYRLWPEAEHASLLAHRPPEILDADLARLALELAAWGVTDPQELRWLDVPPAAAYAQALELLRQLEAVTATGSVTEHGRRMTALGLHPRLAHMLLRAGSPSQRALAADLAALLGERDPLRGTHGPADPDLRIRIELLRDLRAGRSLHLRDAHIDRSLLQRVATEARHWRARTRVPADSEADDATIERAGELLALAYPDRVGRQREQQRGAFLLRNGRGAGIDAGYALAAAEFIVAADLEGHGRSSRVYRAAPLAPNAVAAAFADQIERERTVRWDDESGRIEATERERLGALVLREVRVQDVRADELRQRLAFLHGLEPDWPDVSDAGLLEQLDAWLGPWLHEARTPDDLRRLDIARTLEAWIGWPRQQQLDTLAPTHFEAPTGSRVPIDYTDPAAPALGIRLQELFGTAATPHIGGGRVPLTLHLLSPARRPVQVTRDLASFWQTAYFDVRRDLRGRYPKHYWPDDPLQAEPTRRVRRR